MNLVDCYLDLNKIENNFTIFNASFPEDTMSFLTCFYFILPLFFNLFYLFTNVHSKHKTRFTSICKINLIKIYFIQQLNF